MRKMLLYATLVLFTKAILAQELTVCANYKNFGDCQQVPRNGEIKCQTYLNNLDCLKSINNGSASFGAVTADEAAIAVNLAGNLEVIAEVRGPEGYQNASEFEIVVLVKKTVSSFEELRGLKYCHPGFGKLKVTNYVLNKFEETLIRDVEKGVCNRAGSIAEKQIGALHDFFGNSCRPGTWVQHDKINDDLQRKYGRLLSLCESNYAAINDPFEDSLDCFMRNGDVAVTTRNKVEKMKLFNPIFLDDSGRSTMTPFIWSKRPWSLIVANKDVSHNAQQYLLNKLQNKLVRPPRQVNRKIDESMYLANILLESDDYELYVPLSKVPLVAYIKDRKFIPEETMCDSYMTWCTISQAEDEKCRWFKEATRNQGIYPGIQCLQKADKLDCIKAVENKLADIVTIDNNLGYVARRRNLKAIAFPETYEKDLAKSMVVVKNKDLRDLSNLKGRKGCFAEFGDIAFMSFFVELQDLNIIERTCDYGKAVSEFLNEACVPGAKDPLHEPTKATDGDKLCAICSSSSRTSTNCNPDYSNEYFGNDGALKCLREVGDYAVITNNNFTNDNNLTVLCQNGSLSSSPGLNVEDGCYLSVTIKSELMIRNDAKNEEDMIVALSAFEKVFGQDPHKPFELFNRFDNTKHLLFEDSTPGLNFDPQNTPSIKEYLRIFEKYNTCLKVGDNSGNALQIPFWLTIIICVIYL